MFEGSVVAAVSDEFRRLRDRDEQIMQSKRDEIYLKIPRIERIEAELRALALEAANAVFCSGDAAEAVRSIGQRSLALQAERSELLVENGFAYDYLNISHRCPKCLDTGFVGSAACECFNQSCRREQARRLSLTLDISGVSFRSFRPELYSDIPDARYEVSPRENMKVNLQICRDFASKFGKKENNLLLYGGPGLGKTFLSGCIAGAVIEKGHSVVYDTAFNLLINLENERFNRSSDQTKEAIRRYFSCDLFILDDLGTETASPFATSALYNLINTRLMKRAPMVINTNLHIDELATRYSPQIHSRVAGEFTPLFFFGEDIRLLKKK